MRDLVFIVVHCDNWFAFGSVMERKISGFVRYSQIVRVCLNNVAQQIGGRLALYSRVHGAVHFLV